MDFNRVLVIDIESNGLLSDMLDYSSFPYKLKESARLWCVVIRNAGTGEAVSASLGDVTKEWMQESLKDCDYLVAHNGIKFDFPALMLFGIFDYRIGYLEEEDTLFGKPVRFLDTALLSRLLNPDRYGGHSLEVWGERVGEAKTDFRAECIEAEVIDAKAPKGAEFRQWVPFMLDYCITPDHKLLGKDLRWLPAENFKVGDEILGFDEEIVPGSKGRKYRSATIEVITYDTAPVFEVLLSSGKKMKVTGEHRWLVARNNHGGKSLGWVTTQNLRSKKIHGSEGCSKIPHLMDTWKEDISKDAGWLAGIFDGEGHMNKNRFGINISQRPTIILSKIEELLTLKYKGSVSTRDTKKNSDCVTVRLCGVATEKLRFLGEIRPERLLEQFSFEKLGRVEVRSGVEEVLDIQPIGTQKIIKIQTSTGTFICEGYPMHNCNQDTTVNVKVLFKLFEEMGNYKGWNQALKMESKLADLAIRRENLGFHFNKELAITLVKDLTEKMDTIENSIVPILPPKKMNKGEQKHWVLPKKQLSKKGEPTAIMVKYAEKLGGMITKQGAYYTFLFEDKCVQLPFHGNLKTETEATIKDMDHIKMHLIDLGWVPTEWRMRDLTKDSKKQKLSIEKRIAALTRWHEETMDGKYKESRLEVMEMSEHGLFSQLEMKLYDDRPVMVPTSPMLRVGVEKDLCPNLTKMGDKVAFAGNYALFLTYKHRRSCIAGGEIEDMDFDVEYPNKGYLANYREVDGRIPTPAIEIGAVTNRYTHISVANVPRASSVYGKELRSLFGCGKGFVQLGFDYSSLENRVQAGYVKKYDGGEELGISLVAEKPNDLHSINSQKMGISRTDAKSVGYASLYGAGGAKLGKMLGKSKEEGQKIHDDYWAAVPALKELKDNVLKFWESTGKIYIPAIDGRQLKVRSPHSALNVLFQSAGVICAKYSTIFLSEILENKGYCTDPFIGKPDVCSMIEYHDEQALMCNPSFFKFETFESEEAAKEFIENWHGEHQLSTISHGKKWFITLPNEVSIAIEEATAKTEKLLNLQFKLGFEWVCGKNWFECH